MTRQKESSTNPPTASYLAIHPGSTPGPKRNVVKKENRDLIPSLEKDMIKQGRFVDWETILWWTIWVVTFASGLAVVVYGATHL